MGTLPARPPPDITRFMPTFARNRPALNILRMPFDASDASCDAAADAAVVAADAAAAALPTA